MEHQRGDIGRDMAQKGVYHIGEVVCDRIFFTSCDEPWYPYHFVFDSREHISIYTLHGEPLFLQHYDEPIIPTLKLLHKCTSNIPIPSERPSLKILKQTLSSCPKSVLIEELSVSCWLVHL